ncbi:MAG: hypothetical protein WAK93_02200 [Solirubrobacteraceae bacterium]
MRLAIGLLAAAALMGGGLAAAQTTGGLGHNDPHARKLESELVGLLNSASQYVDRHYPQCRFRQPAAAAPRLVHGPPDRALLATLAILRRPAAPGDTLPSYLRRDQPFTAEIYVDYVRVAHAVDGATFFLFPVRQRAIPQPPRVCVTRSHARLLELLEGKANDLRRLTLKEDAQQAREQTHRIRARDGLFVFSRNGGDGGGDSASLRRWGSFMTSSSNNGPSEVTGVIPDGVVSITAIYDRAVSRGPYNNPKIYPSRLVREERVQDNVVDFTVPRPAEDAFPSRMIWHLSDGRTRIVTHLHG